MFRRTERRTVIHPVGNIQLGLVGTKPDVAVDLLQNIRLKGHRIDELVENDLS